MAQIVLPNGHAKSRPIGCFYFFPMGNNMRSMLTIVEIRRARLEILIERYGGKIADLNAALGFARTETKLSRIRNANVRHDRDGKTFQMGDALAREIEVALNLERGWFDTAPGYELLSDHRIQHALRVMEAMPEYKIDQAIKILDALVEPAVATGTNH